MVGNFEPVRENFVFRRFAFELQILLASLYYASKHQNSGARSVILPSVCLSVTRMLLSLVSDSLMNTLLNWSSMICANVFYTWVSL